MPSRKEETYYYDEEAELNGLIGSAHRELVLADEKARQTASGSAIALLVSALAGIFGAYSAVVAFWPNPSWSPSNISQIRVLAPCAIVILAFISAREISVFLQFKTQRQDLKRSMAACRRAIEWTYQHSPYLDPRHDPEL